MFSMKRDWLKATKDMEANQRVRDLHCQDGKSNRCYHCDQFYPCTTVQVLDGWR